MSDFQRPPDAVPWVRYAKAMPNGEVIALETIHPGDTIVILHSDDPNDVLPPAVTEHSYPVEANWLTSVFQPLFAGGGYWYQSTSTKVP